MKKLFLSMVFSCFIIVAAFAQSANNSYNSCKSNSAGLSKGKPVPGVEVSVQNKSGGSAILLGKTDPKGNVIAKLDKGTYDIQLTANQLKQPILIATINITPNKGKEYTLFLEMRRGGRRQHIPFEMTSPSAVTISITEPGVK